MRLLISDNDSESSPIRAEPSRSDPIRSSPLSFFLLLSYTRFYSTLCASSALNMLRADGPKATRSALNLRTAQVSSGPRVLINSGVGDCGRCSSGERPIAGTGGARGALPPGLSRAVGEGFEGQHPAVQKPRNGGDISISIQYNSDNDSFRR